MKIIHPFLLLLTCALLLTATRASGQAQLILKISNLDGSSTIAGFEKGIELLALSYGGAASPGQGAPAQADNIGITMNMDAKAYPKLLQKVLTSQPITAADNFEITAREPTGGVGPASLKVVYEIEVVEGEYQAIYHEGSLGDQSHVFLSVKPTRLTVTTHIYNPMTGAAEGQETYTWVASP